MIIKSYGNIIEAYVTCIARVRFFVLQFCHVATIFNGLMPCNKEQPTRNTMVWKLSLNFESFYFTIQDFKHDILTNNGPPNCETIETKINYCCISISFITLHDMYKHLIDSSCHCVTTRPTQQIYSKCNHMDKYDLN